jgi:arylsulfatase A-like enzyme
LSTALLLSAQERPAEPVRLVVVISVDQMLTEQLRRLDRWWEGGFERFVEDGWWLLDAELRHGRTETGPGHACIGTGALPRTHGIPSNSWIESDATTTTYRDQGRSPRNLRVPGFSDYLHAADEDSQVVAIAGKDRASIPMTGWSGDVALWWDLGGSGFMSSTFYAEELPVWVDEWNAGWVERLLGGPFGEGWKPDLPTEEIFWSSKTEPDDRVGERLGHATFPHALPPHSDPPTPRERGLLARSVFKSPAGDQFVIDLARRAVSELDLGGDSSPDLLTLGLSMCDTIGHGHGPRSWEVTDLLLRTDKALGQLFEQLDENVGKDRWVAVLTADHGVLALPEAMVHRGFPAVRARLADIKAAWAEVTASLVAEFGQDFGMHATGRGLRFSAAAMAEAGVDPAAVRELAAREYRRAGREFLAETWTWEELRDAAARAHEHDPYGKEEEDEELLRLEAASFDPERSFDVVAVPRRYHLLGDTTGTSHGSPYDYDRDVPLLFLGPGFPQRRDTQRASTVDILPTVLERLGIDVPEGLDGVVLEQEEED